MTSTQAIFEKVQKVKKTINTATTAEKNHALEEMASQLCLSRADILAANELDMTAAKGRISDVMLDRLYLDEERIAAMEEGIRQLIDLEDPVGQVLERTELDNGLVISKKRVAMGVIGIIYESRPNVTSDAAALALKSGSAVVLRSGKDAYQTALAIVTALKEGLAQTEISPDCIQLVSDTSRASAQAMMKAKNYLDLLIPRGGAGLIQAVVENATVPVIETGTGIVHVYVDKDADQAKALAIVENAKTSRPSVCNAMEVLLVHEEIAAAFLPRLQKMLVTDRDSAQENPVELRLDEKAAQYISATQAKSEDFDTEFLDYILAVKLVSSIVTENEAAAAYFTEQVDSAAVYVNASTRFTDGGQFGLGCEMGISTQKLHARGPMGLKELTSYKYVIQGTGQVRK